MPRCLLLFLFIFYNSHLHGQQLKFANISTGGLDATIHDMATDNLGNVYYTGLFYGTVIFDTTATISGVVSVTSSKDGFVAKFDSTGHLIWCFSIGSPYLDYINDIAVDDSGNIAITGRFVDLVNFNPLDPAHPYNLWGYTHSMFVAKYDSSGHIKWAFAPSGGNINAWGTAVAFDDAGNLYCAGYHNDILDLNPDTGLAGIDTAVNNHDIFLAKYSPLGQYLWSFKIGSDNYDDVIWDVLVDNDNAIYIGGYCSGATTDFDPGAGAALLTGSNRKYYVAKYDDNGNFLWLAGADGNGANNETYSITLDNYDHVYAAISVGPGTPIDLDIGPDSLLFVSDWYDPVILQFNTNGNLLKAIHIQDTTALNNVNLPRSIVCDSYGNVYVSGSFCADGMDFDNGTGNAVVMPAGFCDAFLAKYDSSLNYQWVVQLGGPTGDISTGYSLVMDPVDNLYMTGTFCGRTDFDPGPDTLFLGTTYQYGYHRFYSKWGTENIPVSINEVHPRSSLIIYPDPATDYIRLQTENSSAVEMTIYNISGLLVKTITSPLDAIINVSELPPGMYWLHASNTKNDTLIITRFVKVME